MSSYHKIVEYKELIPKGNPKFILRIGNAKLYDSLIKLKLHPKKSLTLTLPNVPDIYAMDFVRGYFDGDGCVYLYKIQKDNRVIPRKLSVIFTSGSEQFLKELCELIHQHATARIVKVLKSRTAYQIRYSTNDALKIFKELYKVSLKGDYLERKYVIFQEFLRLRWPSGEVGQRGGLQNRYAPVRSRSRPPSESGAINYT